MLANYHGHLNVAEDLLERGVDPRMRNDMGQSPLEGAACKGDAPMVRLLLKHGANVEEASPDGRTALMKAAMFNRVAIVEQLLASGPDARDDGVCRRSTRPSTAGRRQRVALGRQHRRDVRIAAERIGKERDKICDLQ